MPSAPAFVDHAAERGAGRVSGFAEPLAAGILSAPLPSRRLTYWQPIVMTVTIAVALLALLHFAPRQAAAIVREDGPVEWLQVVLFAGAGVAGLVAAHRSSAPPNILLALLFGLFIELELDLDQRVFGRPVIDKRFVFDARQPPALRALTVLVIVGFVVMVALYAWRHRRELWLAVRELPGATGGGVLIAGLVLIAVVEAFEKSLGRLLPHPRYFLEESFELIAAALCFLGMVDRTRDDTR